MKVATFHIFCLVLPVYFSKCLKIEKTKCILHSEILRKEKSTPSAKSWQILCKHMTLTSMIQLCVYIRNNTFTKC